MIYIQNIFSKIFLNNETKVLSGLSFFIVSLISFHFIFYFNFYNFSGDWILNESKIVTLQISPKKEEKRVPSEISKNIIFNIQKSDLVSTIKVFNEDEIKKDLGLDTLHSYSRIGIPLIIQASLKNMNSKLEHPSIIEILDGRKFNIHYHLDDLYEIKGFVEKVKVFIFLFGMIITFLYIFLLTYLIKITLISNYKFLEIIQVMGADSRKISINVSFIVLKRFFPGTLIAVFFSSLVSTIIVNLFKIPLNEKSYYFFNDFFSNLLPLLVFLLILLMLLFGYLVCYLYYFLEKRFFA